MPSLSGKHGTYKSVEQRAPYIRRLLTEWLQIADNIPEKFLYTGSSLGTYVWVSQHSVAPTLKSLCGYFEEDKQNEMLYYLYLYYLQKISQFDTLLDKLAFARLEAK